jgi:protein-S-isoprenylcysteine O-methyltransferase Ste14
MMHLLIPLAAVLGIETDVLMTRLKKSAISTSAIALFVLIGIGFLLAAFNMALTTMVGPIWAPLIIAIAALAIALLIYLAANITAGVRKTRDNDRRRSTETAALVTTAALSALPVVLKSPLVRNVGLPLAALTAVILFARSASRKPDEG